MAIAKSTRSISAGAAGYGAAATVVATSSTDRDTANKNNLVKPTEAQLRYAQFHHKRRAQAVKHRIDRLHQTPLEVVVSIGKIRRETLTPYEGDDGYSSVATEDTSDVEIRAIRLRRPKISAGRRAYLKNSKRAYRRRRKDIETYGYRGYFEDESFEKDEKKGEDTEGDFASDTDDHTDNEHNQQNQGQDAADLNEVFATLPKQHNSHRRRRKKGGKKAFRKNKAGSNVDDSYQRFQAACHAMMRNIQTSQSKAALPAIAAPSKRWKRSEAHVAAAEGLKQTDFYRYKTSGFVSGRKKSEKHAALLLSYKYFQQNQTSFAMDRGATWLTHLPAKQAKRSQRNDYYFQNMNELPHLIQQATSFDENNQNENYTGDGEESTSTLAMRKPGPQKFHRLVAYVQHRLIEKEKQEEQKQQQKLQISAIENVPTSQTIGQNRTREIAESFSPSNSKPSTPNRIKRMADSIEGKGGTPTMKLQKGTPFSELSNLSSVGSQHRRKRRKSKYVPRMRLRDFVVEGGGDDGDDDDDNAEPTPLPRRKLSERFLPGDEVADKELPIAGAPRNAKRLPPSPPRTMKLREFAPAEQESNFVQEGRMSTGRAREMALALEGDNSTNEYADPNSKVQQIRKSLEPQDSTPKMKLRGDFDRIDEKKAEEYGDNSPLAISRSSVERLSKQFQSPPTEEQLEDFNCPSREVVDEFSKRIDPRIYEQFENMGQDLKQPDPRYSISSSTQGTDHRSRGDVNEKRQSSATNVTEFFARIRGEQQQRQNEQQEQQQQQGASHSSGGNNNINCPMDTVSHPKSPSEHSDAVSDLSKGTNISGLWNRGRTSISTMTSNLNTIAENKGKGFLSPGVIGKGAGLLSPDVIGKATTGLFNKFRGVPENRSQEESAPVSIPRHQHESFPPTNETPLNQNAAQDQLQHQQERQPDMSPHPLVQSPSIDDHDALRNYRKTRASMSPDAADDMSQASSYHALPDQIREVVQNSGGKVSPSAAAAAAAAAAADTNEGGGLPPRFVSPNRSSAIVQSTPSTDMSTEQYKRAHNKFLENSELLGGEFEHRTIIDTDETQSDYSDAQNGMDPQVLASLMMSPDILQKRLKQAIGSIEQQKWDQILFLINANPWLAEMKELTTNQFLLHKLAFFGTGINPAPMSLSEQLVAKFPSAVHKFDQDGNVPLHLASAAGNVEMIKMLGEKFSSGASIRNEDGMLPLHFAIASFADFEGDHASNSRPIETIRTVLNLFPQAIAIADNDGNLPIHVASECLEGGVGVDVVYLLMDEAERQLQDPYGARFRNKIKLEELLDDDEDKSQGNMSTHNLNAIDSSMMDDDEDLQCTMVLNDFDETPLLAAIRSNKGWEMIEALVSGPGGRKAALKEDSDKNNALHLLVGEFQDATAAMSILKIVPETAFHRNRQGILPIEMACMVMMPEEVILAIALVDLPINIDDREGIKVFKDRGQSWAFLTCDCDDHMVHVVEEILSICSFQQLQELCFWKEDGSEQTVVDRATPKCREVMNQALRFLGRFEFLGEGPLFSDMQTGFKAFDALDFGANEEGKPVLLECYLNEFDFENRVYTMFDISLESQFVEEVNVYVEHAEDENGGEEAEQQQQRCVAIERPRLTLKEVVEGMSNNGTYDSGNADKRMKYSAKICSVLKLIGRALRHLHEAGVVHGNVSMETCGKFEDSSWKLMERLGVQVIGKPFDPARFLHSFPPESLEALSADNDPQEEEGGTIFDSDRPLVSFSKDFIADVSTDIWAFGKICYESLVGKPLIDFDADSSDSPSDDVVALLQTSEWNVSNMETVFADLLQAGIGESGADMITACLFPSPGDRPVDMDEILNNPFWQEIRKHRSPRKGRNRRSGESVSTSVSLLTDVDRYEV